MMRFRSGQIRQLITDLVVIKDRAGRLGMYRTMHALNVVTSVVGWEFADLLHKVDRETLERTVARKLIRRRKKRQV